jgi:hypothetical protein
MTTKRHVKILSGILPEKTIKKAIQPYKRLTFILRTAVESHSYYMGWNGGRH